MTHEHNLIPTYFCNNISASSGFIFFEAKLEPVWIAADISCSHYALLNSDINGHEEEEEEEEERSTVHGVLGSLQIYCLTS